MLSKVIVGSGFTPALKYIMGDENRTRLITSNGVRDYDFKLTAEDFEINQQQLLSINKAVFHGILSFPHSEKHDQKMLKTLSEEYLQKLGFTNAPYIVVEHVDKNHQHMHIISSFIDLSGNRVDNSWIGLRGKKVAQAITAKHGLIPADKKNIGQVNFEALNEREKYKYNAFLAIDSSLKTSNSFKDFESKLSHQGISIKYKYRRGTEIIQGISFNLQDKYLFKGSEIDRSFSYNKIKQTFSQKTSIDIKDGGINNIKKTNLANFNDNQLHNLNNDYKPHFQNNNLSLGIDSGGLEYVEEDKKKKRIRKRGPKL